MDITGLHTVGWFLVGWLALAVLVTALLSVFLRGAHQAEQALPTTELGIRAWVHEGQHGSRRRRRVRAHPPAA